MKFLIVLGIVVAIVLITLFNSYRNNTKLKQSLKNNYGKIIHRKYDEFEMDSIASYWNHKCSNENLDFVVDDITWNDLDMDKVYKKINTTCSSVGEEYLYGVIHEQAFNEKMLREKEELITYFATHEDKRLDTQFSLSKMGKVTGNGILTYFYNTSEKKLKFSLLYMLLSVLALAAIVSLFAYPVLGIYIFITVIGINMIVYMTTRKDIEPEIVSIRYILSLITCAEKISGIIKNDFENYSVPLLKLTKRLKRIGKVTRFIMSKPNTDLDYFIEYIKIIFMMDLVVYNHLLSVIEKYSSECIKIYEIIGLMDMCISIASYRKSLDFYSTPKFIDSDYIKVQDMYHPLIEDPVSNSIKLMRNSLITGSNASGKSTFVKSVAINTILAQTINTCLAKEFITRPSFVITSMAVKDDVESGESYYISEIKSLKRIIDGLNTNVRSLCLIDEILKGTNTIERIAASASILKYFSNENCMVLVATHDIELTEITAQYFDNYHFQEHINDNGISFDYKIYNGFATTKNAIQLLNFMEFDHEIISQANKLASNFEKNLFGSICNMVKLEK